ncbi:MAG: RNA-binding S4 domain-containing protein [Acholeplasmataceae bacterium]|jgi:ribosomal 50S subunit-recycling heat shock protein|nr:RNA-binding S4 domain-containing protein [Acholeplasmataceae bacterium]
MRLDRYLKLSRLIKRRTTAKEASLGNKIYVNDIPRKPSFRINIGDLIKIEFTNKTVIVKVLSLDYKKRDTLMYQLVKELKVTTP